MSPEPDAQDFDAQIASVAALGEPIRRALYSFVVRQPEPVSREQAAVAIGVAHHVAKFHLDKLEADGLLEVEYRRPPGRGGPGAGRPTKLYRRVERDIAVSLPARRYDLAARVMAAAITSAATTGAPLSEAVRAAACDSGAALGREARREMGTRRGHAAATRAITQVLESNGYEPRAENSGITLANCPFHNLSRDYTDLVCTMNRDLIDGLVQAVDGNALRAILAPAPNRCCVIITTADEAKD